MTDEEIKTKRLSDWKPETDIKLQKAFGKFVEEAGELSEAGTDYYWFPHDTKIVQQFENELADVLAFVEVIQIATDAPREWTTFDSITTSEFDLVTTENDLLVILGKHLGLTVSIVGRCQIQGLAGVNPDTKERNASVLGYRLFSLFRVIRRVASDMGLDLSRIDSRKVAKIESKLPWVMGTATDLLPDLQ